MKKLFLYILFLLVSVAVGAQNSNTLSIPDVSTPLGQAQLPVVISNTDEIVAVQFDLTLPNGITADETVTLTNRADGHTATARNMGNGIYRVVLFAQPTKPLLGQSGTVMNIPITVPENYEEGSVHELVITNAVLTDKTGANVLTQSSAGSITVSKLPDLTVKSITADKTTLNPGDHFTVSWQVENVGDIATSDGWSEQVSLIDEDGTSKLIASTFYDQPLSAKSTVSRQAEIALPKLLGIHGNVRLQIRVIPNANTGESASAQGNNMQMGNSTIYINKVLILEFSKTIIEEGTDTRVMAKLNRSGSWLAAETFNITATADSRIAIPATVTIPAGQSGTIFYIELKDDDILQDNDSTMITLSVTGNDYPAANQKLTIVDNELPALSVSSSKTDITEGETFQLTITASRVSANPIAVALNSDISKRFSFPSQVEIPAGETSVTVDVQAVDDDIPSSDLSNAFTVSAPRHQSAQVLVVLHDNDLPVLGLTLTPNKVSESAGVVSVAGILKRTTNKNSKITVKLSDDANGGLYFGNRTLELAKGIEEVHFNFGPVDNAEVDGDRTYTITAAVWLSSCSCSAAGESAGSVTAQLQVFDNDGPALQLTSSLSTVKEGDKTTLTVTRNTATDDDLTITLSSDYDDNLTYNHTVTIPAGQKSVEVEVASSKNDVSGDTHTVVFTVQAEGYSNGTCYIMVTDQTLPDAVIEKIIVSEQDIEVEADVDIAITITNCGSAILPAQTPINIYVEGRTEILKTLFTQNELGAGESEVITRQVKMPSAAGIQKLYGIINEAQKVKELTYNNNISVPINILLRAPYSAIVTTDKGQYLPGETILFSGIVKGSAVANREVEIYLINDGLRQIIPATSDSEGRFVASYSIFEKQMGHFAIGACYPGEEMKEEQTSCEILGINRPSKDLIKCDVLLNEPYVGKIDIINPSLSSISNVKVVPLSKPDNYEIEFSTIPFIAGRQTDYITFKIIGKELTEKNDWEKIEVKIISDEGASTIIPIYYYCRYPKARLNTDVVSINTTMIKNTYRDYPLQLTNYGYGATGAVSVSLPSWMSLASSETIPSIEQGGKLQIVLRLKPTDDMAINIPVKGSIAINCENGDGLSIPYSIEPVSEDVGVIQIDVCDIFTYRTEEAPHVKGANVSLRHPVTGELIMQGVSDANGIYETIIPEGYYTLTVSTNKHDLYSTNIIVDPGRTNKKTVNLSYQAVSINWGIEETEIEDQYSIVTTLNYETNVPIPVVIINGPDKIDGDSMGEGESILLNFTVTNKGLIQAEDVEFYVPEASAEWEMELLAYNSPFVLGPQQSVVIPVKLTKLIRNRSKHISALRRAANSDPYTFFNDCMAGLSARYRYLCDDELIENRAAHKLAMRLCALASLLNTIFDGGGSSSDPGKPNSDEKRTEEKKDSGQEIPGKRETICDPIVAQRHLNALTWAVGLLTGPAGIIGGSAFTGLDIVEDYTLDNKIPWGKIGNFFLKPTISIGMHGYEAAKEIAMKPLPKAYKIFRQFYNWGKRIQDIGKLSKLKRASEVSIPKYDWIVDFDDKLSLLLKQYDACDALLLEMYGDSIWYNYEDDTQIPFWEYVKETGVNSLQIDNLYKLMPYGITNKQLEILVERVNNSNYKTETSDNFINIDTLKYYANIIVDIDKQAKTEGYDNMTDLFIDAYNNYEKQLNEASSSVCASITLQMSQTMTLTRPAYRGTLTVYNGNEETAMTDVRLNLVVKDEDGNLATSHEFQINAENLEGFEGEMSLPGNWTLDAKQTGKATILFIPTKYAAPTTDKVYSFGGTLTYIDPFTGLEVTRSLIPVSLTVKPLPDLELTYFMQRDVYGDDPLTTDVVEPMQPAEFALIINNKGYGDAKNVRMLTEQPKIIDNEKGLLIDFNIKSSQVNGDTANLSFGQTIANSFGDIPAHSQAYAQWWLESSLLGHFTSYEVEATHITSYGNENLSLLDTVTIHEMIHGFTLKRQEGNDLRGFLVNDITDAEDMPDQVYFTDATQQDVVVTTDLNINKRSETEYVLSVNASQPGWNYGSRLDPTNGRHKLVSVVRQSDGQTIPVDNVWQTDRTLRDGKDWLNENRLHFVGEINGGSESYLLTYEPKPDVELAVESYEGAPGENSVLKEQLTEITVKFNKPIVERSFTPDDITLNCQGVHQDVTKIGITKVSDTEYRLALSEVTLADGYYVLTVQTAGITDVEGFNGSTGKLATWIQYIDGMVALTLTASPVEGGSITPESGRFEYDSDIKLKAIPAEGYVFSRWMLGSETLSNEAELNYHLMSNTSLTAQFTIKHYEVSIEYDSAQGVVEGASSGSSYNYGTLLEMIAKPNDGYVFDVWSVNGEKTVSDSKYTVIVKDNMKIEALFKEDVSTGIVSMADGKLKVLISPIPIDSRMYITGNFNEIRQVNVYNMSGIKCLSKSHVQAKEGINTSKLATGVYFVVISTDQGICRTKVVKK